MRGYCKNLWCLLLSKGEILARAFLIGAIRGYQVLISPLFGPTCRFVPSCSNYAIDALRRFGVARGTWLSVKRLLRCHPFHPGGYDPV